jgi:hypothetical protein
MMPRTPGQEPLPQRLADLESRLKESDSALRRWEGYTKALHETALGILKELDLPTLLKNILAKAARLLGTDHGYIFLYDEEIDQLVVRYGIGIFADEIGFRLRLGEGLSGKVWQFGKPLLVDDYDAWEGRSRYPGWDGMGLTWASP